MSDEEDYDEDGEEDDEEGGDDGDGDDEEVDEEEAKRLALEKEEAVRKDIERLRHIFMYIDATSNRIQDTIELNDVVTAQQIEIQELKHIIESQNKSLIEKGVDPKLNLTGEDKDKGKDTSGKDLDSRSRDGGSRKGKKPSAATATYDGSDSRERDRRGADRPYSRASTSNYGDSDNGGGGNDISWSQYENYNDAERADLLERAIEALTKANSKPPPVSIRTTGLGNQAQGGSRMRSSPGRK